MASKKTKNQKTPKKVNLWAILALAGFAIFVINYVFDKKEPPQSVEEILEQARKFEKEEYYVRAAIWFRKAAEQGHADTQAFVGSFMNGETMELLKKITSKLSSGIVSRQSKGIILGNIN